MNLTKRLLHLADKAEDVRQYGKTTLIAKICKELDGVMIAHDHKYAAELQRKYKVTAKSMDVNLDQIRAPIFFDHTAISKILSRAASKIIALESDISDRDNNIKNLERFITELKKNNKDQADKITVLEGELCQKQS